MRTTKFWIVVASRDHVKRGMKDGITQACHGKASPLKRMCPGDYIVYYSGKEYIDKPQKCQQFTAIAKVKDDNVYQFQVSEDFCPYRRNVEFIDSKDISIIPLIHDLQFIQNKKSWGYPFRWGFLEIGEHDFNLISSYMITNRVEYV